MKRSGIIVTVFLLIFCFLPVLGQQNCKIHIVDAETGKAIPFANVCFEGLQNKSKQDYTISDSNGEVIRQLLSPATIAVSCLGYKAHMDTIQPGESINIYLHPTPYKMDDVVVTAQFKPVKADKSIYQVKVLNQQLIENKAATNLSDLLKGELSLRSINNGVLGQGISIQGLSGEYVKILIDGVPVIGRENGNLDLSQLNLNNVDHIEMIEGPMSVIYGNNALAGAINIITKDNRREKMSANLNSYYESVGIYNFDGSFSFRQKQHVFTFTGGRDFFGGYSVADTSRADLWKPKLQYNAGINYSFKHKNSKLKLASTWYNEELRVKGNLIPKKFVQAYDNYYYTQRWDNRMHFTQSFSNKQMFELTSAYSTYNRQRKTTLKNLVNLTEKIASAEDQDTTQFNATMVRATYSSNTDKMLSYQAGYDMNLETGSGKRIQGTQKIGEYAGFLNLRADVLKTVTLQGGLRFIYNTRYNAPIGNSLNLKYTPSDAFTLRISYGRGFRSPSLKELYLNFKGVGHDISGNENLQAEYSRNYNLSFGYNKELGKNHFILETKFFHNNLKNKIDNLYFKDNPLKAKLYNIPGHYKNQGMEFSIQYNLHPRLMFHSGINITGRSKLDNMNTFSYSTDYAANLEYKNLRYKFSLAIFYKYTGETYRYLAEYDENNNLTRISEGYMAGFNTLDVTLSRPFLHDRVTISIGGKNLFNYTNVFSYGSTGSAHGGGGNNSQAVAWGRTFFTRLVFNLNKF